MDNTLVYFIGTASDDYGLNSLSFNYTVTKENGATKPLQKIKLEKQEGREIQYSYTFDLKKIQVEPGDKVAFYFEVFDNDGVNGSKSAGLVIGYGYASLDAIQRHSPALLAVLQSTTQPQG